MATMEKQRGDRLWLVLSTATSVAVGVTLNRYSNVIPVWSVLCLWAIPAVLFVVWFWRVETTHLWVKERFEKHPVSYVLMCLILVPFGWQATASLLSKLHTRTASIPANPNVPSKPAQPIKAEPPHFSEAKPTTLQSVAPARHAVAKPASPVSPPPIRAATSPTTAPTTPTVQSTPSCVFGCNQAGVNYGQQNVTNLIGYRGRQLRHPLANNSVPIMVADGQPTPTVNLVLFDPPTEESRNFANSIGTIFTFAHWNVQTFHRGPFPRREDNIFDGRGNNYQATNTPEGLHCVPGPNPELYRKAIDALTAAGAKCEESSSYFYPGNPADTAILTIFVGKDDTR